MDINTSGDERTAFQFTGSQQQLYRSLLQKDQGLADLYEGALRVYWEARYPARLILAAHSLRELANCLPKAFDLPIPVDPALITDQANCLELHWSDAIQSACHQNGKWTGPVDVPLRKFLHKLHDFFEWLKTNRPKRSEVVIEMFRSTDPARICDHTVACVAVGKPAITLQEKAPPSFNLSSTSSRINRAIYRSRTAA